MHGNLQIQNVILFAADTKIFAIGNSNWRSIDKEYVIQTYILLMYITKLVFMTS